MLSEDAIQNLAPSYKITFQRSNLEMNGEELLLMKNQVQVGKQSTLVNKGKFVMPKDFPKSRPNKIIYSPTMTP